MKENNESKNKPSEEEIERTWKEWKEQARKPRPIRISPIAYVLGSIAGFVYGLLLNSGWDLGWILPVLLLIIPPLFLYIHERNHYSRIFKEKDKYNLE